MIGLIVFFLNSNVLDGYIFKEIRTNDSIAHQTVTFVDVSASQQSLQIFITPNAILLINITALVKKIFL